MKWEWGNKTSALLSVRKGSAYFNRKTSPDSAEAVQPLKSVEVIFHKYGITLTAAKRWTQKDIIALSLAEITQYRTYRQMHPPVKRPGSERSEHE